MFRIPIDERFAQTDLIREDCKAYWNDAIQFLGPDLEEHLRLFLSEFGSILSSSTGFKIRLVVDTNVVLSEILLLMSGKTPFLSRLTCSPFLDAIAPAEIMYELEEKIPERFEDPEEQVIAFEKARTILKGIRIERGLQIHAELKAAALMGERDSKDVVFVQIALEYGSYGVVTKDSHFKNLEGIKQWELGEVGRVLTEVNRGALTLWVIARGFPLAVLTLIKLGMMLVSMGFKAIAQIVSTGVELGKVAVAQILQVARANPLLTVVGLIGIGLVSLFLYSWEPSRKVIDDIVNRGTDAVQDLIAGAVAVANQFHNALQVLVDAVKDQEPTLLVWIECLTSSTMLLFKRLEELEQVKS